MHSNELKIDARRQKIIKLLERDGSVQVSALSEELGTSVVTIRNDLDALERNGYLTRVQGGAVPRNAPHKDSVPQEQEKRSIAQVTAEMIHNGDTLFLNSGTTTVEVAKALRQHQNLNIVTSSIAIASELSTVLSFRVILLGGEINPQYGFTKGGDAQEQLKKYQADYAILSVDGVSAVGGVTTYHADEAIIDRMMAEQAKELIIVADHTKIGHTGFSMICPAEMIRTLVTDSEAPQEILTELSVYQIQMMRA